ncbi:PQQ-binding-like beta-propeller repeat protein [Natrialba sp. SSL1]|uniref:outer membrane protein assembly factor BamB family protein n=1 Tax=Natrialba sp. SSL1 TaxID=1869245 RepID=UPI0008F83909|nr:PQQ-binding-like beta-propeller repeat protein [Natrialba sp. SSL1]OIB56292.1 pyrrolo-quinoline quinone [Natrialba sp. SSL1]
MRRRPFLVAASATTVGLAGCTSAQERLGDVRRSAPERRVEADWQPGPGTWAEDDYGPANRRYNPHATPPRTEPEIDWRYDLEDPLGDGSLVVANGTVYVTTQDRLVALDAADGTRQWDYDLDSAARLKYVDGRLYQLHWGLQESTLVARSPTGDEQWRATVPDQLTGVHEQRGYVFVAGRNRYWTLHADTGDIVRERELWVRNLASANGILYAAFSDLLASYEADGRTLTERWRVQTKPAAEAGPPTIADEQLYVPQYHPPADAATIIVSTVDGETQHSIELEYGSVAITAAESGPIVSPVATSGAALLALEPDGSRRWSAEVSGAAGAIVADGTVYAGYPLTAMDADSGDRLWEWGGGRDGDDAVGTARFAVADSTLYASTADNHIVALRE